MARQTGVLSNSCDHENLAASFVASSSKIPWPSDQMVGLDAVLDALVDLDEHLTHVGVRFDELEPRP